MSVKEDLQLIGEEIVKQSNRKFTGQMNITINMRDGGIGNISVRIDKNLKGNSKFLS